MRLRLGGGGGMSAPSRVFPIPAGLLEVSHPGRQRLVQPQSGRASEGFASGPQLFARVLSDIFRAAFDAPSACVGAPAR